MRGKLRESVVGVLPVTNSSGPADSRIPDAETGGLKEILPLWWGRADALYVHLRKK
jgi:hypothetical protein